MSKKKNRSFNPEDSRQELKDVVSEELQASEEAVSEEEATAAVETPPGEAAEATESSSETQPEATEGTTPSEPEKAPQAPPSVGLDASLEHALTEYVKAMAPGKPQSPESGAREQVKLWRCIQRVLAKTEGDFIRQWGALLAFVAKHQKDPDSRAEGCFGPRYVFRFFPHVKLGPVDRRNFERLLNLILVTANAGTRQLALKQVDLKVTLSGLTDEATRQRIIAFYEV